MEPTPSPLSSNEPDRSRPPALTGEAAAEAAPSAETLMEAKLGVFTRIIGSVAHDYNNLLTSIVGYADLLLRDGAFAGEAGADLQMIREAGVKAALLTRQLLAFSGRNRRGSTTVELASFLGDVEELLRRCLDDGVSLITVKHHDAAFARADGGLLQWGLLIFCLSLREYMPAGGMMTWELRVSDAAGAPGLPVEISLRFDGVSFPDGAGRALLEERVRAASALFRGAGAEVRADPLGAKQWSAHLYLSAAPDPSAAAPARADHTAATILIVDDESALRRLCARVLSGAGFSVLESASGQEAVALVERERPPLQVLVTDLRMPGLDGHRLKDRLHRLYPELRTVFMSGAVEDAAYAPGDLFLAKPFSPETLKERVRGLLARR